MNQSRLFGQILARIVDRLILGQSAKNGAYGLHSIETFQAIIRREQGRVDRNSHCFSLATFEIPLGPRKGAATARALASTLASRARFTDEVGWLDESHMGVLLTETGYDGGCVYLEAARRALLSEGVDTRVNLYTYASEHMGARHAPAAGDASNEARQLAFPGLSSSHEPAGTQPNTTAAADDGRPEHTAHFDAFAREFLSVPLPRWKRAFDIAGAGFALLLLSPIMLATALLIKLVSPGPIFFRQKRVGYQGRIFDCYKFRTMHMNNDDAAHRAYLASLIKSGGTMTKLDVGRDPRIIRCGGILRQTAIDELPQLLNVLKGDMSLVGPRPCIPYEYGDFQLWQRRRVDAVPGMTGLWQVNGKNRTTFEEMIRLDICYARRMSVWMDVAIIALTVPAIITQVRDARAERRGAAAETRGADSAARGRSSDASGRTSPYPGTAIPAGAFSPRIHTYPKRDTVNV